MTHLTDSARKTDDQSVSHDHLFSARRNLFFLKYGVRVLSWLVRCGEIKLALSWFERFILRTDSVN